MWPNPYSLPELATVRRKGITVDIEVSIDMEAEFHGDMARQHGRSTAGANPANKVPLPSVHWALFLVTLLQAVSKSLVVFSCTH